MGCLQRSAQPGGTLQLSTAYLNLALPYERALAQLAQVYAYCTALQYQASCG